MPFVGKWIELEIIMLTDLSQTLQRTNIECFLS
jgi:hypothetical protein